MKILFRRSQRVERPWFWYFLRKCVRFDLWCKLDATPEEQRLIEFYNLDFSILDIRVVPNLFRNAVVLGVIVAAFMFFPFAYYLGRQMGAFIALAIGSFAGWYHYDWYRQTIWVRDLLVGRSFRSFSVTDLVQQEAYLRHIATVLEEVVRDAKTWGGEDIGDVPKLDDEIMRKIIVKKFR